MSVVAGQATAQTIGNLMQITNTPGAILNWQQFNIDVGQTTQFIQQNAASQVFNRVTGGDVSQILGTLKSNGQVFLINPAGVFFGQGAVVDTAGFLASTLAASTTDLLNGHLKFTDANGTAGGIVNQGQLTTHSGGSIVLLAPSIENSGIVHAEGEVLLAAGHSVTIVDMKHPTIGLTVSVKEGDKAVNLGQIISKNASLFSHLVKNSGVVEATGAQLGEGGVIRFIAEGDALVGGQVLAESENGKGGEVDITGERVAVLEGARISADGATGGGTVHVGGGWKGQDASLANAQQTVVQANTQISANATQNGNGGEVVVWADGHTAVDSEVQAKGGALGGNGGRVETSGKDTLAVNVAANTSAPNGEAGQWLIDPANLTIVDEIPQGGFNLEPNQQSPFFSTDDISSTFSPTESFLLNSTVVAGLENNGFVQIFTTGTQPGDGNLTIAAPILISQNPSQSASINPELFLEAKGAINIDAAVGLNPGQTAFDGFDLFLSYDIAKPVYVDAPVYLGNSGELILAPYDTGAALPMNTQGQLPLDGVNLLSGMNGSGSTEPLAMNRIRVSSAVASDPITEETYIVGPEKTVKLNVLGANLSVNELDFFAIETTPATDIRVGVDNRNPSALVQGNLQYNFVEANSLTVDAGSTVSTFTRTVPDQSFELTASTGLNRLISSGTVNFNGGFGDIFQIDVNAGTINFQDDGASSSGGPLSGFYWVGDIAAGNASTINLVGSTLTYDKAELNGAFNLQSGELGQNAFLNATDTDLNGNLNIGPGFNLAGFQALGMGSTATLTASSGSFVSLGGMPFSSGSQPPAIAAKAPGAFISSTNGQFVAQQGARIILNGAASPNSELPPFQTASISSFSPGGAVLDITGLDGRLDAPVTIQSNGFLNSIQTEIENSGFDSESPTFTPINTMVIESANIQVNAGGDGRALRIGEVQFSDTSNNDFIPLVDLDFNGTLTVNSGRVRLEGDNVSTTDGSLNVNGANSTIVFSGAFTSADLYQVNRSNGGNLAAEGFWDNSAVTAGNAATAAPLSKGNIFVGDDLVVSGGLLSSAGTSGAINVLPDSFLELRNTEVTTTINVAPTGVVMLGLQDESGAPVTPVVLNDARINMGGDAFLIVESDSAGVANLDGTATINSSVQGNLILAGRRVFDTESLDAAPDTMTLNVGTGIRLNVAGNTSSLPPGLALYYSERQISQPPARPVFLVGQLTPEAVAITEYDDFNGFSTPATTVLTDFANPSFVIDGNPDFSVDTSLNCSQTNFCVKFDVAQNLTYSGMVMSTLGAPEPTLANSGVAFVAGADLTGVQFAVQTSDEIQFMQGLNIVTAADFLSGKRVVNGMGSTVRFGANAANENISNNFENNGLLQLQGTYTFSGLLSGIGTVENTGNLFLTNTSGSSFTNAILNNGSVTNSGIYNFAGPIDGIGNLFNNGTANIGGSGPIGNQITNTGIVNLNGGTGQSIQFAGPFNNSGMFNLAGGSLVFQGDYTQSGGVFNLQPGSNLTGNININGGSLNGFSTINGNLNVAGGRIVPGASPGLMTVTGDLNLDANSIVDIEILSDGGVQGVDFDCIVVQGNANLAGQLNLIDISSGTLTPGSQYAFLEANTINGTFGNVSVSSASSGYTLSPPVVTSVNQVQRLSTSTVALNPPPVEPPPVEPPPVEPPPVEPPPVEPPPVEPPLSHHPLSHHPLSHHPLSHHPLSHL
ncbi:two-partner secretion domain-containing protein [Limnobacter parvus]